MLTVLISVVCVALAVLRSTGLSLTQSYRVFFSSSKKVALFTRKAAPPSLDKKASKSIVSKPSLYKRLYHQLHNLEDYSFVLPEARDALVTLFAEAISEAKLRLGDNNGILALERFDAHSLSAFIHGEDDKILSRLNEYTTRRNNGGPRELFQTLQEARAWLIQRAPSKLVDGAWLGHVHRITTPFHLRSVTKNAWQVLSEELGDGDLSKNHAAIFRTLLQNIGAQLPEADSPEFIEADFQFGVGEAAEAAAEKLWKGSTAQLLISLFPTEFLPEVLGFNMHFECLTWDTVRASRELREMRLDDYYFLLHISIDNSDSGHTAMALQVVVDYLEQIRAEQGEEAVQQAWKRVQIGYLLSEKFTVEDTPSTRTTTAPSASPKIPSSRASTHNPYAPDMIRIFKAKATVAAKLHCGSRVKIGSKKLSEWLDYDVLGVEQGQTDFLTALSNTKAWIRPGSSGESRLVREFEWNGKMFGAFTESELDVLRKWVDALVTAPQTGVNESSSAYWDFVEMEPVSSRTSLQNLDVRAGFPVLSERGLSSPWKENQVPVPLEPDSRSLGLKGKTIDTAKLLPIWFAHASLLDGFVSIPVHTCTVMAAAVVKVMRAQRGFAAEGNGVSGMDEFRRPIGDCQGLLELGLEMGAAAAAAAEERQGPAASGGRGGGDTRTGPQSLEEEVPLSSRFAMDMLHWSMRPVRNRDALLGMAWAFVDLHLILAGESGYGLLSEESRMVLRSMADREREALLICREEIRRDNDATQRIADFDAAAASARQKIGECFV